MHANEQRIHDFYTAFASKDAEAMAAMYAEDARFSDPVFPELGADEVRAMWRMLISRGTDLELSFDGVSATDELGHAHWDATYTFRATGRLVRNSIDASFRFRDGHIVEHRDDFSLWRWTRMALGSKGTLLGWTPLVQRKVRRMAARQLEKFMAVSP